MVRRELFMATSILLKHFKCWCLLQTETQYSYAENTRACVEIRSVLAEDPKIVPARRRKTDTLDVT